MKYSPITRWLFLFWAIVIGVLFSFNFESADADYYIKLYDNIGSIEHFAVEPGYVLLCKFFKELGFDYLQFRIVLGLLVVILICSTIRKYSKYPSSVLFCYFCYPFLLDCAQVRHMIVCAIFIYAIRYLEVYNLKNLLRYIVCIGLAASIQMIAFAFIIFLILYIVKNKYILYRVCIIGTIVLFISANLILQLPFFKFLMELRDKGDIYNSGVPISQLILYLIYFIGLVFFATKMTSHVHNKIDDRNALFLQKISMLSVIFLPTLLIDFQFTRLFRASIIPIYISCWNNISTMNQNNKVIFACILILICTIVFCKLFIFSKVYYETLTYPIIFENYLLN